MTPSQRQKQNKLNGQKSKGPKTEAGKERSRQNALKHGFTAVDLTLPIESTEVIQAEADAWFETLEPEGTDQINLANQIVLASLKIKRFAKAETAIAADQVRDAQLQWDIEIDRKLKDLKKQFRDDPSTAVIELKSFGKGLRWLMTEWGNLIETFHIDNCWSHLECIRHAIRLLGIDPADIALETAAQEFAARAVACIADPDQNAKMKGLCVREGLLTYRYFAYHPNWVSYDRGESIAHVRDLIKGELRELMRIEEFVDGCETESRGSARLRASVLDDTPKNRLLIRYAKSTSSELDRTLKTLVKLKQVREEEVEMEAEEVVEADFRNEPEEGSEPSTKDIVIGSCVTVGGVDFAVHDKSEAMLSLAVEGYQPKKFGSVDTTEVSEVVSTPMDGV